MVQKVDYRVDTHHKRKRPASVIPILFGLYPRCKALSMITGKALEYFSALARCCPPQPVDADFGPPLTLENSIRHCRKRIKLGMLIIRGTTYFPPQFRSGLSVEEVPIVKNMHADTNRSPSTLAYDVNTSARSISPNFPSFASAIPPTLTRFKVLRNQYRPVRERRFKGRTKNMERKKR